MDVIVALIACATMVATSVVVTVPGWPAALAEPPSLWLFMLRSLISLSLCLACSNFLKTALRSLL